MTDKLIVNKPFFMAEEGDEFIKTDHNTYSKEIKVDNTDIEDDFNEFEYSMTSLYEISENTAKSLLKEGYLKEFDPKSNNFVNVFDEIGKLKNEYIKNLENIDTDYKGQPGCLKTEAYTVYKNMIKLLSHLESLKK